MRLTPADLAALALLLVPHVAAAQADQDWNSPRARELIERARDRRAAPATGDTLRNYQARANGYVYFYLDRKESDQRTLVKVDQVALDVFWGAPNRTKQRIVGLRDANRLPNRMRYHLDHLTVVQNEFDDRIRLGDGDEVRDVPHPAGPGTDSVYDVRLADSLSLYLSGAPEPVRVYELEVRPRRLDRPALIGSIYIDRATAAIVRMAFTFTPASYVDRRLDYIHVQLENGLWDGRHWLPHEQRIEIRRQLPELDFPAGGVIRGIMRIGDYRFNVPLPDGFFSGYPVVALPREMREAYAFDQDLFEGLHEEGLGSQPDLAALRREAVRIAGQQFLSGLPRIRLHLPNASSALRFNRAEGLFLGAGLTYAAGAAVRLDAGGGYALAPDRVSLFGTVRLDAGDATGVRFRLFRNELRDLGPRTGAPGALNTLFAALTGHDYLDPYFADGAGIQLERRLDNRWRARLELGLERHRSAHMAERGSLFDDSAAFRPVRSIRDGRLLSARASLHRTDPPGAAFEWRGTASIEAGTFDGDAFATPTLEFEAAAASGDRRAEIRFDAFAGAAIGTPPPQRLFLAGGRESLPGYPYRSFVGDRFALARLEASHALIGPWIRFRASAAFGWSDLHGAANPDDWAVTAGGGRASAAVGLGLFYDILRFDLARGLNDGGWRGILSVRHDLWDIL